MAKQTEAKTPLTQSLERFSAQLYKIIAFICLSVWAVNIPKFSGPLLATSLSYCLH